MIILIYGSPLQAHLLLMCILSILVFFLVFSKVLICWLPLWWRCCTFWSSVHGVCISLFSFDTLFRSKAKIKRNLILKRKHNVIYALQERNIYIKKLIICDVMALCRYLCFPVCLGLVNIPLHVVFSAPRCDLY